jgi:SAM-dependent methyltransferase
MLQRLKRAAKANPALVRAVRATYPALGWASNRRAVYTRVAPYLAEMQFDEVRLGGRGNEPEALLRRTSNAIALEQSDVLVLGAGAGDELSLWEQQHPRSLTATDFLPFPDTWQRHDGVRFAQADVRRLPFADRSFDLIASTALFEHVNGVDALCAEMARVLRPGGLVFANFGPLFYTYRGAHFSGAYEHLWMTDAQFEQYLEARAIPSEIEDGLLWLRSGMFSRLRYDEYRTVLQQDFELEHVILGVSADALRYKRSHPEEWRALCERQAERDLLTFSMTVWMRPRAAASFATATAPAATLDLAA